MSFIEIVVGTPAWVWVLFVFLMANGIRALNDRVIEIKSLFIMPLVFLLWGGVSVSYELTFFFWGGTAMLWGLLIGFGFGWRVLSRGPQLKSKEGSDLIIWPGTSWPIIFMIIAFITNYTFNICINISPELRAVLSFNILFGFLSGLNSGVIWGKILNLYLTFKHGKANF